MGVPQDLREPSSNPIDINLHHVPKWQDAASIYLRADPIFQIRFEHAQVLPVSHDHDPYPPWYLHPGIPHPHPLSAIRQSKKRWADLADELEGEFLYDAERHIWDIIHNNNDRQ